MKLDIKDFKVIEEVMIKEIEEREQTAMTEEEVAYIDELNEALEALRTVGTY